MGALGLSLLLAGAIAGGAAWVVLGLGGPLLGYAEGLDIALWCLFAGLPLFLISVFLGQSSELLHSRRRWCYGTGLLGLRIALTLLLVCGFVRVATRYRAPRVVRTLIWNTGTGTTDALAFESFSYPVTLTRTNDGHWVGRSSRYRGDYEVILNLVTGKTAAWWRTGTLQSIQTVCSPNGRRAAYIGSPDGLTWQKRVASEQGSFSRAGSTGQFLRIVDLPDGRVVFRGWPRELGDPCDTVDNNNIGWSADGRYLAVSTPTFLCLFDDAGRFVSKHAAVYCLYSWKWSPTGDCLYVTEDGNKLLRVNPDGSSQLLWQSGEVRNIMLYVNQISPDGRWLVVAEDLMTGPNEQFHVQRETLWAVRSDGRDAHRLLASAAEQFRFSSAWTGDSRALYVALREANSAYRLLWWRPGQPNPEPVSNLALPTGILLQLAPRPKTNQAVAWIGGYRPEHKRLIPVNGIVLLLDSQGVYKVSPASPLAVHSRLAAFDPKGHAVLYSPGRRDLLAVDLDTGASARIYPK